MSKRKPERRPRSVPRGARRGGETLRPMWRWVEPAAWSPRMLAALETGVKGGRWYSLMDKVARKEVLEAAFRRVKHNGGSPGVDHVTIERFEARQDENLSRLSESLMAGTYQPQAIRRRQIRKHPGSREKRQLGIPTVRDRVVQGALRMVMEPIFEWEFAEHSYGFRPERGCHDALAEVESGLEEGLVWVVDVDLRRYFDTLDHETLLRLIRQKVSDGKVLHLLEQFLHQEVMEGLQSWTPERGSPQGAVISPLLANIYLDPLDHLMAEEGFRMVRYADDLVILCRSEAEAQEALAKVAGWVERMRLELHPDKTRIVDASQGGGFDFLGYHFERGHKWPSSRSLRKLKWTLKAHTHRANGHSLEEITRRVNRVLNGWFLYFQYSSWISFRDLDGWLRGRLRSILRKRRRRRGRARGRDHQRWPNAYFVAHGLVSLAAAYESAVQSSRR